MVKAQDWTVVDMPDKFEETFVNRELSNAEYRALIQGFRPRDMDDRWFMYVKDSWLYLHRSWTGNCIFKVKLDTDGNGYTLTMLMVNRNTAQHKSTNIETDKTEFNSVLNMLIAHNLKDGGL